MKRILEVPNVKQLDNHCGPACLSMILLFNGEILSQADIVDAMGLSTENVLTEGVHDNHILLAAKKLGYKASIFLDLSLEDIAKFIDRDLPLITACRSERWAKDGHYYIIRGYETNPVKRVYINDPGDLRRRHFMYKQFSRAWDWGHKSGIVVAKKSARLSNIL